MTSVKTVCVYCGSSGRVDEAYRNAASRLGTIFAKAGIGIVYGGGRIGLMGLMADAALAAGGRVTGIIPHHLHEREVGHASLTEMILVDDMHSRKRRMFDLSDAFVTLPGGLGTLDETIEMLTWKQLGLHDKPIILVNVAAYWAPLLQLIDHAVTSGFAGREARHFYRVVGTVEDVLAALAEMPEASVPAAPDLA